MKTLDGIIKSTSENSEPISKGRRKFLEISLYGLGGMLLDTILPSESHAKRRSAIARKPKPITHQQRDYSQIRDALGIGYKEIVKEPNIQGVNLAGRETQIGKIQRALRWKNIADAVGARYGVPSRYLIGMMGEESYGDPTQPNALEDGGVGLIHMQPHLTSKYGLKMITNSKKLRDFKQGKRINGVIDRTDADLKDLIKYDDRFHPVKNIDAAARMLCDAYEYTYSWQKALERYAGRKNYDSRVMDLAGKIKSKLFMKRVRNDFNQRNKGLKFGNKPLTFERYLAVFNQLNGNYGLDTYSKLKQYKVK